MSGESFLASWSSLTHFGQFHYIRFYSKYQLHADKLDSKQLLNLKKNIR